MKDNSQLVLTAWTVVLALTEDIPETSLVAVRDPRQQRRVRVRRRPPVRTATTLTPAQ